MSSQSNLQTELYPLKLKSVSGSGIDVNFFKTLFLLQKVKQSTERQRELENEQARALDLLNSTSSGNGYIETDVPSLQSKLRELEKKIELETVHYEELMLELTLSKRHDKASQARLDCSLPCSSQSHSSRVQSFFAIYFYIRATAGH